MKLPKIRRASRTSAKNRGVEKLARTDETSRQLGTRFPMTPHGIPPEELVQQQQGAENDLRGAIREAMKA